MYVCKKCGDLKEQLEILYERHPYGSTYAMEAHKHPYCLCGGKYENAVTCEFCGEYLPECESEDFFIDLGINRVDGKPILSDVYVCKYCANEILKKFKMMMSKNFTMAERQLLNELMDGEML